jgi:hypothetical protein
MKSNYPLSLSHQELNNILKSQQMQPTNVTSEMLVNGYPMPIFGKLFDLTIPKINEDASCARHAKNKEWKYVLRYLKINKVSIEKEFSEIQNKKISNQGDSYNNGCIINKTKGGYIFRSFTVLNEICVINHVSFHTDKEYGLKSGYINNFVHIPKISDLPTMLDPESKDNFIFYGDGNDYVNEYVNESINRAKNNDDQYWDIIK